MKNEEIPYDDIRSRELKTYSKYFSDEREIIDGIFKFGKIRFTQSWELNDPLEFNPCIRFNKPDDKYWRFELDGAQLPSAEDWLKFQLIESHMYYYGILSLSKNVNSFDMWSRYANGHKGFIIEFKEDFNSYPCMKSEDGTEYTVEKVEYTDDYTINIDELLDNSGKIPFDVFRREVLYKKTSRWESEKEYRMVRPLWDCPYFKESKERNPYEDTSVYLFDFSLECVESITFGAYMSAKNKELIALCCENTDIEYLQAVILKDEEDDSGKPGRVRLMHVDDWGGVSELLTFSPEYFCKDTMSIQDPTKIIKIGGLSEIPYYTGNEKHVEEMYERAKEATT